MGLDLGANELDGGSTMGLASTSVHAQCPKNSCGQCLCPQDELQLPHTPLQETLKDRQIGLNMAPIELLPLPWIQSV